MSQCLSFFSFVTRVSKAEVYHQFHNDFQSPAYGKAYNELADLAFDDGRVKDTGCPDRI